MKHLPVHAKAAVWEHPGIAYVPTPVQLAGHASTAPVKVVVGGERGGKSTWTGMELLPYVAKGWPEFHPQGLQAYLIGPTYKEPRAEFQYIMEALDALELVAERHVPAGENQPWSLRTKTGNWLRTWSGHDPTTIRSWAAHIIALCEAGKLHYDVRLRAEGRLSETGGLLVLSGTFEGSLGWYPQEYQTGQIPNEIGAESFSLPSWANVAIFPGGEQDPKILRLRSLYPKNIFDERVAAIPSPPSGIVFPEASYRLHVGIVPWTPGVRVDLAIDPGFSNAYAVLPIQSIDGVERIIEGAVYVTQHSTPEVIALCQSREWWRDVQGGTIDIAAAQHTSAQAEKETDWDLWNRIAKLPLRRHRVLIDTGITTVRSFMMVHPALHRPRLFIDRNNTGILSELGLCPTPEDIESNDGPWRYIKRPDGTATDKTEDRNNHALKALGYHLVTKYGAAKAADNSPSAQKPYERTYGRTPAATGGRGSREDWRASAGRRGSGGGYQG